MQSTGRSTHAAASRMLNRIVGGCFGCKHATPTFSYASNERMRVQCAIHGEVVERDQCNDRTANDSLHRTGMAGDGVGN